MRAKRKSNEKGSILILTVMAVLILSVMVTGLLNVGTTEIYTTRNYKLTKTAYYTAVEGAEEVRNIIADPENNFAEVSSVTRGPYSVSGPDLAGRGGSTGTIINEGGVERSYMTGTLEDLENSYNAQSLGAMSASVPDEPDPRVGYDLSNVGETGVDFTAKLFNIFITSQVKTGSLTAYSEVIIGINKKIGKE
jgi:hypothetical protein